MTVGARSVAALEEFWQAVALKNLSEERQETAQFPCLVIRSGRRLTKK